MSMQSRRAIIVAGGNFAGLTLARALCSKRFQVTVMDPGKDFEWYPGLPELVSRQKRPDQLRHDRKTLVERLGHAFVQASVTGIDRDRKRVTTSLGQSLPYDDLALCIGNTDTLDRIEGARDHALPCGSIQQAETIARQLQRLDALSLPERPVVLVGANFVGLELLGEIIRRYRRQWRFRLHVIDAMPTLLPAWQGLHAWIQEQCQDLDIRWHLGQKVSRIGPDRVELQDGSHLDSRLTLWCGGDRPHPFLAGAGLAPQGGYAPVLPTLQSIHDPRIWIAGDACAFPEPLDKQAFHALGTARKIAANLRRLRTGERPQAYRPIPTPRILSFGETAVMLFRNKAIAHPGLLAGKEAVYHGNYHPMLRPRESDEWRERGEGVADSITGLGELMWLQLRGGKLHKARYFPAARNAGLREPRGW